MESRDAQIDSIIAHKKIVDNQIAQISSTLQARQQGALPAQPTRPTDQAFAITLRSGLHYDGPPMPRNDEPVLMNNANLDSIKPNNVANSPTGLKSSTNISDNTLQGTTPRKVAAPDKSSNTPKPVIKLPFPNRHLKTNLDKQFGKFLEMVKDLQVTVPFTELIT